MPVRSVGLSIRILIFPFGVAILYLLIGEVRLGNRQAALPANLIRGLFYRFDLRLHRKIVVIDGQVAYTGSLNMVDPQFFKQGAGVGQWIDAMVRVRGPAVEGLAVTFLEDWELETREGVDSLLVRFASHAHKGDLLAAGVRIARFHGGLLHTKSITVDGQFSLFGSVNLDPRSLWLNTERR